MRTIVVAITMVMWMGVAAQAEDLGNLSANPFLYESTANPLGKGSPFAPNGINNPLSPTAARSVINRPPIPSPPRRPDSTINKATIAAS